MNLEKNGKKILNRILGIDFGSVRVGLALSDLTKTIAKPFDTIKYNDLNNLIDQLKIIIRDNEVNKIVVGIPFNMKGNDTKQTLKVREFIIFLEKNINLEVETVDERLSSIEAEKTMHKLNVKTGHNKGRIDKIAASVILQEYLDTNYV